MDKIIIWVICLLPIFLINVASFFRRIKFFKPIEVTEIVDKNLMKEADVKDYPLTDEEFELARDITKKYNSKPVFLAILSIIASVIMISVCNVNFPGTVTIIYSGVLVISTVIFFWVNRNCNKCFVEGRNLFRRKKAYQLSRKAYFFETLADQASAEGKNVSAYMLKVGIADSMGYPMAFELKLSRDDYYSTIKNGECDAILYKGMLVALCNFNPW